MTNTTVGPLVIRTPQDAIAAVPYLLGFHPADSLVVVGFDGPHHTCALRLDLPAGRAGCERTACILARNHFRRALVLGYGPADPVAAAVADVWETLTAKGVQVVEALRVAEGRWWSMTCVDPGCCPPEGRPYDITVSPVAAQATLAGHVALPDREELARSVAPLGGPVRAAMRKATERAERRFLAWAREGLSPARIRSRMAEEGVALIADLPSRDTPPSDDDVAWLGVLLTNVRVRDEAWVRIDEDSPRADIDFWRYVLRRVEEPYVPGPACLLAYAAFIIGDGGLANVALDRAARADPDYSMAALLSDVIAAGIPPAKARLGMTPEELARAYGDHDTPDP
ncbi:DUF4192 domain-containing protein [Actinomadura sp. NBRC 104425]|uniref:DUF4192 domain-containing protein n=1 Tax=Actinomadura sp. NBRC 104425 TaxID=3032204 RepID=UPI00255776EC|nr:DUF4192 domain-containing protein [Actinomadura sp. NBRC 104425]